MRTNPLLKKLKRGPQVVLPKDIGAIIAFTGVGKTSRVVDAGAGSGWLAISLGNIAKSVVTYERRDDFAKLVEENIRRAGLKNVKVKRKDVFEGIGERNVDLVTLDLADSHAVVKSAYNALREGGFVVGYLPHAEQASEFARECRNVGFGGIFTIECIVREMLVRDRGFRPENFGLWHTAYLLFARKEDGENKAGGS
ncbi:MAG: rRNA adenine N-6-methyltransferase family protein [Candidatus Micrarchaeota archaeon]